MILVAPRGKIFLTRGALPRRKLQIFSSRGRESIHGITRGTLFFFFEEGANIGADNVIRTWLGEER